MGLINDNCDGDWLSIDHGRFRTHLSVVPKLDISSRLVREQDPGLVRLGEAAGALQRHDEGPSTGGGLTRNKVDDLLGGDGGTPDGTRTRSTADPVERRQGRRSDPRSHRDDREAGSCSRRLPLRRRQVPALARRPRREHTAVRESDPLPGYARRSYRSQRSACCLVCEIIPSQSAQNDFVELTALDRSRIAPATAWASSIVRWIVTIVPRPAMQLAPDPRAARCGEELAQACGMSHLLLAVRPAPQVTGHVCQSPGRGGPGSELSGRCCCAERSAAAESAGVLIGVAGEATPCSRALDPAAAAAGLAGSHDRVMPKACSWTRPSRNARTGSADPVCCL